MSTSGQHQFRYTQTPSKVLHLRNLPWECNEEELVELCKPFGKIVNTKCNVGANRNQAFVEFTDLNQAISMVSYFASSSEPAQVRGKTVYIQYSNRHEIVNNKSPGDVPGNVLLVTIEGVEAGDVSIDVIHLVFSAFGFVHKIATFEKAAGFQALIQFSDANIASEARNALDGRSIPRYLLPEHVGSCNLRISYSAHTDLNIKFQSHRSRDYTNPYLPVNPTAIEGVVQPALGPDGKKKEHESNVLLASIENMQYAVTVDVLHTVFSAFGTVQKIAIFEKNGQTQALIQYPDVTTASVAREALEGHCIYDGGYCKLHLSYSRHTDLNVKAYSDKSRDYTIPDSSQLAAQVPPTAWQNPQAAMYPGNEYTVTAAMQAQVAGGQVPSWDPNLQAGRQTFVSTPSTFPGQSYTAPPVPGYAPSALPTGSSPLTQTSPVAHGAASMGITRPGVSPNVNIHGSSSPAPGSSPLLQANPLSRNLVQPWSQLNVRPEGVSPPGHPPYYGQ
ncbi:Polypyrimidine tract-binding-like protein [Quillaja saponaria]|uniref:Polypyrimidine tract-binding-like protein n=1 Tax=Quillaja saponaria TaxID=32244 RepID=A0AAD7PXI0_QUISA|nr:Polypyrimidine tract-binding-like protein [Quillaja saponaria]